MSPGIFQRFRRLVSARSVAQGVGAGVGGVHPLRKGEGDSIKPWLDLQTLMAIDSLELRVRHAVRGVSQGIHRSVRRGTSSEFAEYRPYLPGDDLRHLDWRRMARTSRALVRQYEDEADWTAMIVLDLSASMGLGSVGYSKGDYARTLAGTLGMFLQGQGDSVGLVRFGKSVEVVLPAIRSVRGNARWWSVMCAEPEGNRSCLGEALEVVRQVQRRASLVVVVSDFLMPMDSWRSASSMLRASGHQLVMVEVLDVQETEFPFKGDTRFEGLEGERALDLEAERVRDSYLSRLREHRAAVEGACRMEGGLFWSADTKSSLESVMRPILEELLRRREERSR